MSKLLIKLRHAPDDEIQEIHSLLQEHQIDFYETQSGPWGISAPGIWVNDDHQYDRAKALLDNCAAPDSTGPSCKTCWKIRYRSSFIVCSPG